MAAFREFIEPEIMLAEGRFSDWVKSLGQYARPASRIALTLAAGIFPEIGGNLLAIDELLDPKSQEDLAQQVKFQLQNPMVQAGLGMAREKIGQAFSPAPKAVPTVSTV